MSCIVYIVTGVLSAYNKELLRGGVGWRWRGPSLAAPHVRHGRWLRSTLQPVAVKLEH